MAGEVCTLKNRNKFLRQARKRAEERHNARLREQKALAKKRSR
jgi:hypothetical protein